MIFTGIGSRVTPRKVLLVMTEIAKDLCSRPLTVNDDGWTLYSGASPGADSAFEEGCDEVCGDKEIFLPREGFNGSTSKLFNIPLKATEIAKTIVPHWNNCSKLHRKFHSRNVCQILGYDLETPTDIVVCWHEGTGGTMTAVNLALSKKIPVINLAEFDLDKTNIIDLIIQKAIF